jgi:transcriptional regulator with XRE-family HTH domain
MAAAIREARTRRGLSQAALAGKVAVDVKTIGRIENGQMVPNLTTIWALADILEVPIGFIAGEMPGYVVEGISPLIAPDQGDRIRRLEERVEALVGLPDQVAKLAAAVEVIAGGTQSQRTPGAPAKRGHQRP